MPRASKVLPAAVKYPHLQGRHTVQEEGRNTSPTQIASSILAINGSLQACYRWMQLGSQFAKARPMSHPTQPCCGPRTTLSRAGRELKSCSILVPEVCLC